MGAILKIIIFVIVQWFEVSGDPFFQGISFQRGFEINFKPFPIKPLEFIKEKWSPLGVFGKKFSIHKRSLDDMVPLPPLRVPRPAAPVFEHIEEIEQIGTGPLLILPKPVTKPPIPPEPVLIVSPKPPPPVPIQTQKPPPVPLPVPMPIIINELPPLPEKPHKIPPISTNMVLIQPTKVINNHITSSKGLYTDISRVESVKEHIHSVKPIHPPHEEPKPLVPVVPVPPPEAPKPPPPEVPKPPPPVVPPPPPPVVPPPPPPVVPPPPPPVVPPPPPQVPPVHPPPVSPVPPPPVSPVPPPPVKPIPPPVPPKEPHHPPHPIPIKELKEEKKVILPHPVPPEIPKTDIHLKDSTLIRGSKMALQFGTVFLTLMAQFFDSARATIDQMTNPPPVFKE